MKIENTKVRFDKTIATLQKERSKMEKTSVSLKEEKHQLGRAKSYLNKFADNKNEFNISKADLGSMSVEELKKGITEYRNQVRQAIKEEGFKIEYTGKDDFTGRDLSGTLDITTTGSSQISDISNRLNVER